MMRSIQFGHAAAVLIVSLAAYGAPASPEASFQAAVKARATGDLPAALTDFEAALTLDPDNIRYGSEYRQAVIQAKEYERSLKFFEKLVADHPNSAKAHLNYGFAYVDKIPAAGSITQVILANTALTEFTKSIDISPSWIAYYTRGNSYLFWPKVFLRASLGVADLEKAYAMQKAGPKRSYHVRVYISLGDGYWKTDNLEKARTIWTEGLREFPDNAQLKARLARTGDDLKMYIDSELDPNKRVDTNLHELWASE
jgi:tetratricopeptide (TPR) repeat protein